MASGPKSELVRHLRFVVASWKEDGRTDGELLALFCESRDEQAFTTLVGRHGRLVWGACTRVLGNTADAEDAFQATFLRLSRDADKILRRHNLSTWLYRVARCSAIDLRRANDKHKRIEKRLTEVADRTEAGAGPGDHLRTVLDDELEQLPERYRTVLILCHLEGRTYADVGVELGCSVAAVHRMATRAQDMLRQRLVRQGYAAARATTFCLAAGVAGDVSAAPLRVLAGSVEEGLRCGLGGALPATRAGALAAAVPAAGGVNLGTAALVGAALVGTATTALLFAPAVMTPATRPALNPPTAAVAPPTPVADSGPRTVPMTGTVVGPDGRPNAGATVVALARPEYESRSRGLRDAVVARTTAGPDGRFALRVPVDPTGPVPDRAVAVQATHPGRTPASRAVRFGGTPDDLGEFKLEPATDLRGRLFDATGRPAEGVTVRVVRVGDVVAEPVIGEVKSSAPPGWPEPVRTGPDGGFALPGLGNARNVWARVADPRFALDTLRVDGRAVEEKLVPARAVEVRVTAADTGAAVADARITVLTERLRSHPYFCVADAAAVAATVVQPGEIDFVTDGRGRTRIGLAPGESVEVLVHPPAGQPYVGVRRTVVPGRAGWAESVVVELPRGRWVEGVVRDGATGLPVDGATVHWGRDDATKPEWRDSFLIGRDAITRTGPDGAFRLAVLPGPVSVRVYGPSLDYLTIPVPLPGTKATTLFAHHVERFTLPELPADAPRVEARLRKGRGMECRIDGAPDAGRLVALCSGRVSPVRGYSALPVPVTGRSFAVPGCVPGTVARTYFLDPVARVGGVANVAANGAVRLEPCGSVRVKVTTAAGEPVPGCEVTVSLLLDRDRPAGTDAFTADAQPADWFDPVNYPTRPLTGDDGTATLPALIPEANYAVSVLTRNGRVRVGTFRAAPGATTELPTATVPDQPTTDDSANRGVAR